MKLLERTQARPYATMAGIRPGWRLVVPLLPWKLRGYLVTWDAFGDGWWFWAVSIQIAPLDIRNAGGFNIRVGWGWLPSKAVEAAARAESVW